MARVLLKPAAEKDVAHLVHYFLSESAETASRFHAAVEDACKQLAKSPELGGCVATSVKSLSGMRQWMVPGFRNYVIFYHPVAEGVEIVRILHGARNWQTILNSSGDT